MISHRPVKKGTADVSVTVRVIDSTDGTPETGVAYNTAGIDLWYRRGPVGARTAITEATQTVTGAHADGGFVHISDGYCRLDLPDDACSAGGGDYVEVGGTVTGMIVIGCLIPLQATGVESKLVQIYSDTTIIYSDTSIIYSDTTIATSKAIQVYSDTAIASSKAVQIYSDTTIVASDSAQVQSKVVQIYSDTTIIYSDTTRIHSDTTVIESQTTIIKADAIAFILLSGTLDAGSTSTVFELPVGHGLTTAEVAGCVVNIPSLDQGMTNCVSVSGDQLTVSPAVATAPGAVAFTIYRGAAASTGSGTMLSKVTVAASDVVQIYSDTTIIYSDTSIIYSDTTIATSKATQIYSDTAIASVLGYAGYKKATERLFVFVMTDSTNHAPASGLTVTAVRSLDGGAFAPCSNAVTAISNGVYKITLSASDLNADVMALRLTATAADDLNVTIKTQA